ncbi:hypothetical protein LDC_2602 [sediment metagenome]|uniref:Leucine-binding protein domain-containing protein n=1 Tax=sediment metagenome TaxID=749907 RepID=D9PM24_9ZZZZ
MGPWYFGSEANNEETSKCILPILKRDGFTKIGMIFDNVLAGRESLALVKKLAPSFGLEFVGDVATEINATDATAEVSRMKALNPQAIWMFSYGPSTAAVAKAQKALSWRIPIYALSLTTIPATKMAGIEPFEGWRLVSWCNNDAPEVQPVIKDYKQIYGSDPTEVGYFMGTYAATLVQVHVLKAMAEKNLPFTRSGLRDAAANLSGGVQVPIPKPRLTKAYGDPPHILVRAEDFIALEMKGGKLVSY